MATKNAVFMRLVAFCKRLYEDEYSEEYFENEGESEYINENDDMYREEDYDDDDL